MSTPDPNACAYCGWPIVTGELPAHVHIGDTTLSLHHSNPLHPERETPPTCYTKWLCEGGNR